MATRSLKWVRQHVCWGVLACLSGVEKWEVVFKLLLLSAVRERSHNDGMWRFSATPQFDDGVSDVFTFIYILRNFYLLLIY